MRPSDAKVRKWKGADTFLHQPGKLRLISSEEDSEGRTDVGRFISRASGGLSGIRTRRSDANILITLALDEESLVCQNVPRGRTQSGHYATIH